MPQGQRTRDGVNITNADFSVHAVYARIAVRSQDILPHQSQQVEKHEGVNQQGKCCGAKLSSRNDRHARIGAGIYAIRLPSVYTSNRTSHPPSWQREGCQS
jgi:hypothetical protein